MARTLGLVLLALGILAFGHSAAAFSVPPRGLQLRAGGGLACTRQGRKALVPLKMAGAGPGGKPDPEEVTKKWGLEAGIFSAFKQGDGTVDAKQLLKKYGSAYLLTSISLSLVSFTLCYLLVDAGVDVPALLAKVGIEASSTSEKAGTAALAYAAHKAASPIRFPPTVALTPLVARYLFNKEIPEDEK